MRNTNGSTTLGFSAFAEMTDNSTQQIYFHYPMILISLFLYGSINHYYGVGGGGTNRLGAYTCFTPCTNGMYFSVWDPHNRPVNPGTYLASITAENSQYGSGTIRKTVFYTLTITP